MTPKTCSIPDCGKPIKARGWCASHYSRWRIHGDPFGGRTGMGEALRYFSEVVLAHVGDECLPWPYGKDSDGYGKIKHDGSTKRVHRLVCEAVHGPAPTPQHEAAHSCGNGHEGCCAPGHLVWKTPAENWADKLSHGTHNRGERNGNAKLTSEQVQEILAFRGVETRRSLSNRFGVSESCVGEIQSGRSWSWL